MSKNQVTVPCPQGEWTNVSGENSSAISFQVLQGPVYVRFAATDAEPDAAAGGYVYKSGEGEASRTIADLAAGVSSGALWAKPIAGTGAKSVIVDIA